MIVSHLVGRELGCFHLRFSDLSILDSCSKMVRVAIAGGTGNLGRTLVDAIVERGGHEVFVLSRKVQVIRIVMACPRLIITTMVNQEALVFSDKPSVKFLVVDYGSTELIARCLSQNQVHTVISTMSGLASDVAEAELRLIRGAAASGTVKRFAPAEFGFDYDQDDE